MDYKRGLARNPKLFYIANFFIALDFIIPIWVLFYQKYLMFSQIGILNAAYFLFCLLFELPTGALADLIGRKRTILLGYGVSTIGYIANAFGTSFWMFAAIYLFRAFGASLISGSDTALVYDSYKELKRTDEFPKQVARGGFIFRMGLVAGTFFGGYLYTADNRLPYIGLGIAQLIAFFILFFLTEPRIDSVKFTLSNYLTQIRRGTAELLKTSHSKKLTVFYVLLGGITWSYLVYFNQPYATDVGFSASEMGVLFAVVYFISSTTILFLAHCKDLVTRARVYRGLPIILAIALVPAIFASTLTIGPLLLLMIFCGSSRFAFLDRYVNEEFQSQYRATALSSLNMIVSIIVSVVIGMSGFIQERYGTQIILTFMGLIVAGLLVPMGFRLLQEYRRISPSGGQSSDQ